LSRGRGVPCIYAAHACSVQVWSFAAVIAVGSRRHLSTGLAALSAALVTVALTAWPALAAGSGITPSSETVQAGQTISLSFTGFKPCSADESLTVRWDDEPLLVSDVTAGPAGSYSFTAHAVVPSSPLGLIRIDAGCSTETQYLLEDRGSVYVVTLTPSVQRVQAGQPVTIAGSGFTQCTDTAGSTTVALSANGTPLATASGSNGDFQQVITVPAATAAGPYPVTAGCSDQPGSDLASTSVDVVTLALSPSSGTPGTTISVTGGGFTQCHEVQLQLLRDATQAVAAGSPIAAANGSFTAGMTVPSRAAAGNDYQVDAGCYPAADGNTPIAIEQFTVTPPATSGSPTPSSTSPSTAQPGTGSPSATSASSTSPSTAQPTTGSASSPGSPSPFTATSPQSPGHTGLGVPVALVGSTGAGLVLAALLLARALSLVHGRRGRGWVNKHLRVTADWAAPLAADVERRPGATSISVGLEPHLDHRGNQQQYEEAAR
jgi:hypothetical protein